MKFRRNISSPLTSADGLGPAPRADRHTTPVGGPSVGAAAWLVLCALMAAPMATAQSTNTFGDVIDVRVVNIEVVVEENGEKVRGLNPSDFVLEVDGRETPIEYFTEVLGGVSRKVDQSLKDEGAVPALAPGEAVGTSYLIFIDDYSPIKQDRDRVLDGLIEQLPNLQPQDRAAVVAFDGKQLEMLSNWSQSLPALTRSLQKAKTRDTRALQRIARNRAFETDRDLADLELGFDPRDFESDDSYATFIAGYEADLNVTEERYARLVFGQADRAIRAAAATLRSFAGPPGRKVMLLLSGGWPSDPSLWATGDAVRSARGRGTTRGQGLLAPLIETANLLSYTIYPVDVPGVSASLADTSETTIDSNVDRFSLALDRERQEEAALFQIARETGGKALLNTNRTRAFEAVVADTRSYYWLGFTPSWKGNDTGHRVAVRLRNGAAKVRARRSFSDLSRSTEVNMMVESTLRIGSPPSVAPLRAQIERGSRAGIGKRKVPIKIAIPLGQLTFLPVQEGWAADAELRVAVLDRKGITTEIPVVPMALTAKTQPAPDAFTVYETEIKMRNERHDLVLSLYDKASGKILSAKLEVPAL